MRHFGIHPWDIERYTSRELGLIDDDISKLAAAAKKAGG